MTWAKGVDQDGKPIVNTNFQRNPDGTRVCPGAIGLTNSFAPSYNPETGLLYVATSTECDIFTSSLQIYRAGHDFLGSVYVPDLVERPTGALKAIDILNGTVKWSFPYFSNPNGGALSTSGGVVFAGDSDGNFICMDAKTGHDLWHVQLGAAIYSTSITFELDGNQYVVIPAGSALLPLLYPSVQSRDYREFRLALKLLNIIHALACDTMHARGFRSIFFWLHQWLPTELRYLHEILET